MTTKGVHEVGLQILSPPEGSGVILEFLDEYGDAFMAINIDSDGVRHAVFYESSDHISLPLSELKRGIEIAEEKVCNVDPDALFVSGREP